MGPQFAYTGRKPVQAEPLFYPRKERHHTLVCHPFPSDTPAPPNIPDNTMLSLLSRSWVKDRSFPHRFLVYQAHISWVNKRVVSFLRMGFNEEFKGLETHGWNSRRSKVEARESS